MEKKYEKPYIDIIEINFNNIICDSGEVDFSDLLDGDSEEE